MVRVTGISHCTKRGWEKNTGALFDARNQIFVNVTAMIRMRNCILPIAMHVRKSSIFFRSFDPFFFSPVSIFHTYFPTGKIWNRQQIASDVCIEFFINQFIFFLMARAFRICRRKWNRKMNFIFSVRSRVINPLKLRRDLTCSFWFISR